MAWIEKKRDGFRAIWRENGKRKQGPTLGTKQEAETWAVANGYNEPPTYALIELVDDFCASRVAEKGIQKTYASDLAQRLPSLFRRRNWTNAEDVTVSEIDRWWRETGGTGVRRPLAQLLSLLRWAFHHRDVPVAPKILTYRAPRQQRKVKPPELLATDQITDLLEAAAGILAHNNIGTYWDGFPAHLIALLHYLTTYGPRPVTACKLKISDVNFATGQLTLRAKRSGEWQHPLRHDTLHQFAACVVGREQQHDAPLFLNFKGEPWKLTNAGEADQLAWWYHKHLGQALKFGSLARIYKLKKYAISIMRRNGMDNESIARFTGHLTKDQVEHYQETSQKLMRDDLDKLPKMLPPQKPPRATPKNGP
jgi:Phage integrase family